MRASRLAPQFIRALLPSSAAKTNPANALIEPMAPRAPLTTKTAIVTPNEISTARRTGIAFDPQRKLFTLDSPRMSYVFRVAEDGDLVHVRWGRNTRTVDTDRPKLRVAQLYNDLDKRLRELPDIGRGDTRTPALEIEDARGHTVSALKYHGHRIVSGKPALAGLPGVYAEPGDDTQTLIVELRDPVTSLRANVHYSLVPEHDAICRHVEITNDGPEPVKIKNLASWSTDFTAGDYRTLQLSGAWAREAQETIRRVQPGKLSIESRLGMSGHQHNPFLALLRGDAGEERGEVFGLSLAYSGSFVGQVEQSALGQTRVTMGLNPANLTWELAPGETFTTPECVGVFSSEGLNGMSQRFHHLYRDRMCRGPWRDELRPMLINSWEASYFNFTSEDIERLAKAGKELGLELVVVDDGWFGTRDDDHRSLGDWREDPKKLPEGLEGLGKKIEATGMKLGLWVEPEMINPDSDLYRAHPDWCLHVPKRDRTELRHQLVLDLSRQDVQDHLIDTLSGIFARAPISYVKWDFNRFLTEVGSALLPAGKQGEVHHRYVLGLYRVLDAITQRFPNILFEGCASGGGRFDPGMLFYMPQTWTSDNTDALARLRIQWGTSYVYPAITMGAHVSAVPNHQEYRTTPLDFRAHVAMSGNFGYELDPAKLTEEERVKTAEHVALYRDIRPVVQRGDFHRLRSPIDDNWPAWMFTSREGDRAVVFAFQKEQRASTFTPPLRLAGLDPEADYAIRELGGKVFSGCELMYAGLELPWRGDYSSRVLRLDRVGEAQRAFAYGSGSDDRRLRNVRMR
jgi:alpha-galactosidase